LAQIRFEKVTKRYGTVKAVDEISLVAEDKEFMVLVGPSGCGKTTTLRMIAGLEQADSDEIAGSGRWRRFAVGERLWRRVFAGKCMRFGKSGSTAALSVRR
jgi:ABC-type sugar transport system ATPase subunit